MLGSLKVDHITIVRGFSRESFIKQVTTSTDGEPIEVYNVTAFAGDNNDLAELKRLTIHLPFILSVVHQANSVGIVVERYYSSTEADYRIDRYQGAGGALYQFCEVKIKAYRIFWASVSDERDESSDWEEFFYSSVSGLYDFCSKFDVSPETFFRHWYYIPHINFLENGVDRYNQFCGARTRYFEDKGIGEPHYPAATGIGTAADNHFLSVFLGIQESKNVSVSNLYSSFQKKPNFYSPKVLHGVHRPLFQRGKILLVKKLDQSVFISGTAAVIDESSFVPSSDTVRKQTLLTLKAIKDVYDTTYDLYRVYLSKRAMGLEEVVLQILDESKMFRAGFIVEADVCRSNLLIEIEACKLSFNS